MLLFDMLCYDCCLIAMGTMLSQEVSTTKAKIASLRIDVSPSDKPEGGATTPGSCKRKRAPAAAAQRA